MAMFYCVFYVCYYYFFLYCTIIFSVWTVGLCCCALWMWCFVLFLAAVQDNFPSGINKALIFSAGLPLVLSLFRSLAHHHGLMMAPHGKLDHKSCPFISDTTLQWAAAQCSAVNQFQIIQSRTFQLHCKHVNFCHSATPWHSATTLRSHVRSCNPQVQWIWEKKKSSCRACVLPV